MLVNVFQSFIILESLWLLRIYVSIKFSMGNSIFTSIYRSLQDLLATKAISTCTVVIFTTRLNISSQSNHVAVRIHKLLAVPCIILLISSDKFFILFYIPTCRIWALFCQVLESNPKSYSTLELWTLLPLHFSTPCVGLLLQMSLDL